MTLATEKSESSEEPTTRLNKSRRWFFRFSSPTSSILVMAGLLVPIVLATVIMMTALWPDAQRLPDRFPAMDPDAVAVRVITTAEPDIEIGTVAAKITAIEDADAQSLAALGYEVPHVGQAITVNVATEQVKAVMAVGSKLRAVYLPYAIDTDEPGQTAFIFLDYDRTSPIGILAVLYGVLVLAVARWRGLAAIAGLAVSVAVLGLFTLPALLTGQSPFLVALVSASAIMFAAVYVAHGVSVRTSTALVGTIIGLAITAALASWASGAAQLTGLTSEEALVLPGIAPDVNLRGIALCGIVLAGLGVLNDVTITQSSAVWELRSVAPEASRLSLFTGAMRIGRDHIASTVYTIVFAYLGASLPLFMILYLQQQSLGTSLTSGAIAEEVVRTLVSSIGLVLAIPVTTGIAAALVPKNAQSPH